MMYDGGIRYVSARMWVVIAHHHRLFLCATPLILVSWVLIVSFNLSPDPEWHYVLGIGHFFGSLFGQVTLAAAWTALGPGRIAYRVALSLAWLVMLGLAVTVHAAMWLILDEAVLLIGCLLGQWVLLQIPLWAFARGFNCGLRPSHDAPQGFDPRHWQFGIRQLIIVTAIVGIAFGIGRLVVTSFPIQLDMGDGPILIYLVLAASLISLPLLFAAFMQRLAWLWILLSLVLVGVATAFELPLFTAMGGAGPEMHHFIAINGCTAAVVLLGVLIVRLNGYTLAPLKTRRATEAIA